MNTSHSQSPIPSRMGTNRIVSTLLKSGFSPFLLGYSSIDNVSKGVRSYICVIGSPSVADVASTLSHIDGNIIGSSFKNHSIDILIDHEIVTVSAPPNLSTIEDFLNSSLLSVDSVAYDYAQKKIVSTAPSHSISFVSDPSTFDPDDAAFKIMEAVNHYDVDIDGGVCHYLSNCRVSNSMIDKIIRSLLTSSVDISRSLSMVQMIPSSGVSFTGDFTEEQSRIISIIQSPIHGETISVPVVAELVSTFSRKEVFSRIGFLTTHEKSIFEELNFSRLNNPLHANRARRIFYDNDMPQGFVTEISQAIGMNPSEQLWEGIPPSYIVDGDKLIELGYSPNSHFGEVIKHFRDLQDSGEIFSDEDISSYMQTIG